MAEREREDTVQVRVARTVILALLGAFLVLTSLVTLATPVLADDGTDWGTMGMGQPGWIILVIAGAFFLIVGLATKDSAGAKKRSIAVVIGALLLVVALVPVLLEGVPEDVDVILPPSPTWTFDVLPVADHTDGASFPGGVFTDCDTIFTAGNTPEWQSAEAVRDLSDSKLPKFQGLMTVATTLSRNSPGFTDYNCMLISHSVDLTNGVDNNEDGTIDAVSYTGRLISINPTATKAGNDTGSYDVVYQDSELRWYVGFQDDGNDWVEIFDHSEDFPQGSSNSFILGNHNGGSADTVHFFIMFVDYGMWNYDTVVNDQVEIVYEIAGQRIRVVNQAETVT